MLSYIILESLEQKHTVHGVRLSTNERQRWLRGWNSPAAYFYRRDFSAPANRSKIARRGHVRGNAAVMSGPGGEGAAVVKEILRSRGVWGLSVRPLDEYDFCLIQLSFRSVSDPCARGKGSVSSCLVSLFMNAINTNFTS